MKMWLTKVVDQWKNKRRSANLHTKGNDQLKCGSIFLVQSLNSIELIDLSTKVY